MHEEWTEKYRPGSLADVVGNDSAVRSMKRWADAWVKGVPKRKALVLRGEAGIGKTSAALALAKDYGWDIVEMNASDHRNAESIRRVAGMGSVSQTFTEDGDFLTTAEGKRKLIVLDEADNLFGREDYGGARAIVETIRETSQPMILIVNDYYALTRKASAVKSLAESITFRRLDRRSVAAVLGRLCQEERVDVSAAVLDRVAENAGGDLRGAINDLQMLVEGRTRIGSEDIGALGKRNQETELNASLADMFGATTAKDARNATLGVDKTPDELVIWVDENIPLEFRSSHELAKAFDALSRSDIYLRRTRSLQHYGLWSYAKEMMTSGVALSRKGSRRHQPRYNFPGYLIAMSRSKSSRAAKASLCSKLAPIFHTSSRQVGSSVVPFLRALARRDKEMLTSLGVEADLDEGDVALLLGDEPGSAAVTEAVSEIRRRKTGGDDIGEERKKKPKGRSRGSLADF